MYLHRKRIHPSVLAVMEQREPVKIAHQRTSKSGAVLLESAHTDGRKIVVEVKGENPFDRLYVPINERQAFVLNENDRYEMMRIDEGLMDMVKGASQFLGKLYTRFIGKLKNFFRNGEEKRLYANYKKDPKKTIEDLRQAMLDQGMKPSLVKKQLLAAKETIDQLAANEHGVQGKDLGLLRAASLANDRMEKAHGDEKAQAQILRDGSREIAGHGDRLR